MTTMNQTFEKSQKDRSAHRPLGDHKPKRPLRGDRRDHIEPKSLAGSQDNRGLSFDAPGSSCMEVRAHPRFIPEEYLSPFALGLSPNSGVFLFQPLLDQRWILLQRLDQRPLAGESKLYQEASDRGQRKPDAILLPEKCSDHAPGPEGKLEFQLKRIFGSDRLIYPPDLAGGELFGPPYDSAGLQSIPTSGTICSQPLVNTATSKSQSPDHRFWTFPVLDLLNSSDADGFTGFMIDLTTVKLGCVSLGWGHASLYHNPRSMYSEL